MTPSVMLTLTLAYMFIALPCGQMQSTSPESCPVIQTQLLTVNGCPIFVHDVSRTKDFVVEPLMCITQSINDSLLKFDNLTQKIIVNVPVTLRDDALLAQIKNQLQHLSPKSVKFAPVSRISVSTDASSKCVQALMILWSQNEEVGYLDLGIQDDTANCSRFFENIKDSIFDAINGVTVTAEIEMGGTLTELNYKLMLQNQTFFNPEFYGSKFAYDNSNCDKLQFIQSVTVGKCIARVFQMQGVKGRFHIEPLLCPSNNVIDESVIYDYSRDMYYLKLDVVLQDSITLNAVQSKLAHLSPTNVSFLQLWRVEITMSSFLRSRFDVGPLMVSGDWRSGQVRVYCKTENDCKLLRSNMIENPLSFWRHVNSELTSHIPNQCTVRSGRLFYNIRLPEISGFGLIKNKQKALLMVKERSLRSLRDKYQTKIVDDNLYVIIQQRMSDNVSFARTWNEYEAGFGDATNFWIGLYKIHLLSINGVTFRVEMKLVNGSEVHQEYANFKVKDASTNYTMTCGGVIESRSSCSDDKLNYQSGMQFSTMDRDNDKWSDGSCSAHYGNSGWWFNDCGSRPNEAYVYPYRWSLCGMDGQIIPEFRLMLQI